MISLLSCHIDNSKKPDLVFEKEKSRETDFQCLSSILADIDECSQEPCLGVENSICKNSNGSYNCECIEGFRKSADGSTCEGKKKKPKRTFHYGLKTNIKPRHDVIYVHKLTHRIQGTCLLMLWWSVMWLTANHVKEFYLAVSIDDWPHFQIFPIAFIITASRSLGEYIFSSFRDTYMHTYIHTYIHTYMHIYCAP